MFPLQELAGERTPRPVPHAPAEPFDGSGALHYEATMRKPWLPGAAVVAAGLASFTYHCSSDDVAPAATEWTLVEYGPGRCLSVNARGDAVGIAHDNTPFVVRDGTRSNLPPFADALTVPLSISDDGTIVGYAQTDDGRTPIRFVDGAWRALEGVTSGVALGTAGARIVGYAQDTRAFLWSDGKTQDLPLPPDRASLANAASENAVAGILHTASGEPPTPRAIARSSGAARRATAAIATSPSPTIRTTRRGPRRRGRCGRASAASRKEKRR